MICNSLYVTSHTNHNVYSLSHCSRSFVSLSYVNDQETDANEWRQPFVLSLSTRFEFPILVLVIYEDEGIHFRNE